MEAPSYWSANKDHIDYELEAFGNPELKWFQGYASMMLSYNCQVFFFFVRGELMHKTTRRIRKIVTILMSVVCVVFICMCYAAYFSLGKNGIPVLFTLRKKIRILWLTQAKTQKTS